MFHPLSQILNPVLNLERVVAYRQGKPVQFSEFRKDVAQQTALIRSKPYTNIVLALPDSYDFAVCFLATLHSGGVVIIPANMQEDSLIELQNTGHLLLRDRDAATECDGSEVAFADLPDCG